MTLVAPRIVNSVSCVTRINQGGCDTLGCCGAYQMRLGDMAP